MGGGVKMSYNAARDAGLAAIAERDEEIARLSAKHDINCKCPTCEWWCETVRGITKERDAEIARLNRMVDALVKALANYDIPYIQNVETHWREWAEQQAEQAEKPGDAQ